MPDVIVQLPLDRTGRAPNNLIGSEEHVLKVTPGFPYKIITLEHGGFYVESLRVYDEQYNKLVPKEDYIVTYEYKNAGESIGLKICGAIVFLDPLRTGTIYTSAQMVGGDLCYSFTVVEDYVKYFKEQPINYRPHWIDYVGNEPLWKPGELEKERWKLDTYQPFNNEIGNIGINAQGADGVHENNYREQVIADHEAFLAKFNDRLDRHIQDINNPHVDIKSHIAIDLGQLENYRVATEQEAIAGTSNELYMTPYLTSLSLNEWAVKPLNTHINDKNNPHEVTLTQVDTLSTNAVDGVVGSKYLLQEQVANSNYAAVDGTSKTYTTLYNEYRYQLQASNFAAGGGNGYLPQGRYGRGAPGPNTVLLSNSQSWVDFGTICQLYGGKDNSVIYFLQFPAGTSQQQAFNVAMTQPQVWTAPLGSMFLYNLVTPLVWGTGNGSTTTNVTQTHGCIKTESGWAMI